MNKTKIEWTATVHADGTVRPGYTSNPIKYWRDSEFPAQRGAVWGCIKASEGCANCYAESINKRFHGRGAVFTAKRMESLDSELLDPPYKKETICSKCEYEHCLDI